MNTIMLEKSFALLFFVKRTGKKNIKKYIYARITVDGISKEISTKTACEISRWDQVKGRLTGNKEDAQVINHFLETFRNKVYQARNQLIERSRSVTAAAIRDIVLGKDQKKWGLLELFAEHNQAMAAQVPNDFSPSTLARFKTTLGHVRQYLKERHHIPDIELRDIDQTWIEDLVLWLKTIQKCQHNTAMKYLTGIKKVILIALRRGLLKENPFVVYKIKEKTTPRLPLNQRELLALERLPLESRKMKLVRDAFIFSCYTGLSYCDLKALTPDHLLPGTDDRIWIITKRQKTQTMVHVPLLHKPLQILQHYRLILSNGTVRTLLPLISLQKLNLYLKDLAKAANIQKPISFHLARYTFATTVALDNGVPLETISFMLGHTSLRQTHLYTALRDQRIAHDMKILSEKLQTEDAAYEDQPPMKLAS